MDYKLWVAGKWEDTKGGGTMSAETNGHNQITMRVMIAHSST